MIDFLAFSFWLEMDLPPSFWVNVLIFIVEKNGVMMYGAIEGKINFS